MKPDYVGAPGDLLAEWLEEKNMSQVEFARLCDWSSKFVSELKTGKSRLTERSALVLERVTGIKAQVWMNMETNYRIDRARLELQKRKRSKGSQ